ncbi:MAG TPA: hypothetical protein VHX11_03050, partial [Acidobacteriaceae bacterium]|nr:hypothetical protein [Acidobacteriaceae bacterium]
VTIYKIPDDVRRSDLESATHQHNVTVEQDEAIRRKSVQDSLLQGYVLTPYFYNVFSPFEKDPRSLSETIGEMVYGMDITAEVARVKNIDFVSHAPAEVIQETRLPEGLDLAEADLAKGTDNEAEKLAKKALSDPNQAGRANFILAQVAIRQGDVESAQKDFEETVRTSKDPRTLAWSHIYLGRIYDVENQRDQAVTEYQAALTVRDGQPDTKRAAEKGLEQAYAVPQTVHTESDDGGDAGAKPGASTPPATPPIQPEQPKRP